MNMVYFDSAVFYYNGAIKVDSGVVNPVLAHLALGEMYDEGQGLSKMHHDSYYYYNYAAERSNADALWKLGVIFEEGRGADVEKNAHRAFYYFKLSARGGHARGLLKAGDILYKARPLNGHAYLQSILLKL